MNKQEVDRSQRKALGKGLSALLPGKGAAPKAETPVPAASRARALPEHFEQFESVPLDRILPGSAQPRSSFEDDKLEELAQSIRTHGILQPVTVVRTGEGTYRLVAGERRWRAAGLAGLTEIPALVRSVADDQLLELALIENIQREDLNPIETALAFSRLIAEHKLTHEQVSERTGKDRSTITNLLRLLKLPPEVQQDLIRGDITMGHARALLALNDSEAQRRASQKVLDGRLSVRETEKLVKDYLEPVPSSSNKGQTVPATPLDPNVKAALDELQSVLGTRVRLVQKTATSGTIHIEYYSQDDLDRIYAAIVH